MLHGQDGVFEETVESFHQAKTEDLEELLDHRTNLRDTSKVVCVVAF